MKCIRALLIYAQSPEINTLSYHFGWPKHFMSHPRFNCISLNINDRRLMARVCRQFLLRWGCFDAIIILHSVFSNACYLGGWLLDAVRAASQPKAYFIGNEYKLMPEKMEFCETLGISLLVSQSNSQAVHALYRERSGCTVIGIPNTGLDTDLFSPNIPNSERPIDLGYRAFESPLYFGHNERRRIADYFSQYVSRYGLIRDISLDPAKRFARTAWGSFLNQCKGQLGTEAGGDYFELSDTTRNNVNQFIKNNPSATMEEIFEKFFKNYTNPVPLRIISGRNVEAAGTKTVQILFEGYYNGYFQPDVHYIPLKKDFSNIDDVMAKFRDEGYCSQLTENAYNVVVQELTYQKLIDSFNEALDPLM